MPKKTQRAKTWEPEHDHGGGSLAIRRAVEPATPGQRAYLKSIRRNDVTICDGRAGTGKTYLAVGMGLHDLLESSPAKGGEPRTRLVIARPALEAGERLGFLPGKLEKKVEPYLEPIFDALRDFSRDEQEYRALSEPRSGIVEIVPLAYMRGRTFHDAFVILDEAQNATPRQMEMFLTRMGRNAKVVVIGDTSQSDLLDRAGELLPSGLARAIEQLEGRPYRKLRLGVCRLGLADVMRNGAIAELLEHWHAPAPAIDSDPPLTWKDVLLA